MDQRKRETFEELKAYFKDRDLPRGMANNFLVFRNVKFTVELHISRIERQIELHGANVKKSVIAGASKARLIEMKEILENESNEFLW